MRKTLTKIDYIIIVWHFMPRRLAFLFGLVLLIGFVTRAFAETPSNDVPISRASAVTLLVSAIPGNQQRVNDMARTLPPLPLFKDTDQSQWYAPYLEVAFKDQLIHGYGDGTFRPGANMTVSQAIMLVTAYRQKQGPSDEVVLMIPGAKQPTGGVFASLLTADTYGINYPLHKELTAPISRAEFFTMLTSAGIQNANAIVVQLPPKKKPSLAVDFKKLLNGENAFQQIASAPAVQPNPTSSSPAGYKPDSGPVAAAVQVRQGQVVAYRVPVTQQVQPIVQQPRPVVGQQPVVTQQPRPVVGQQPVTVQPIVQQPVPTPTPRPTATTTPAVSQGFNISMPTLGISNLNISHPKDLSAKGVLAVLQSGVGHLFSYPGQGGTILVYGHSSSYSWDVSKFTKIFRQINKLAVGDLVYVNYGGKQRTYRVTFKQTVPAGDTSAYAQKGSEELILYTCWPPDSISQRYLVHASPVDTVASN